MPIDLRTRKLAQLAVKYCTAVKPGENVILSGEAESLPFLVELYKAVILAKAHPIINVKLPGTEDFFYKYATSEQINKFPQHWMDTVKSAQAYIGIYTETNTRELTNCPSEKITQREKVIDAISDYIVNTREKIRRVTIAYPILSQAIEAEMSLTEYENFIYNACLIDWKKLGKRLDTLSKIFERGKQVHLKGENVDLKFSIKGKNCVADKGEENMPGGEIFMAPFRESTNGWIKFEYPALWGGKEVTDITLKFEKGKVIEAQASKNEDFLIKMLDIDENARYLGEFGIGCSPNINRFTKNLLFDEKINGTIHLALGMAYKQNGGGNDSALHWDMVKDMKNAEIILDGKVVQKNGEWLV